MRIVVLATVASWSLLCIEAASAQPIGTFRWQQQP